MSVLETPRLYFRGKTTWDSIVTNNQPQQYDEDDSKTVFGSYATDVQAFRKDAIAAVTTGGNWNPDGTHRSIFYETTIVGVDTGSGVDTDDSIVKYPVSLTGMLVDLDPYGALTSQVFFDTMTFGIQEHWGRKGLEEDRPPAHYVARRENATERIRGRVLDKGLGGDETGERLRLVIDRVDGRVHHLEMDATRAEEIGRGMIVVAGSTPPGPRAADRNILDIAGQGGVYRPSEHLERARSAIDRIGGDPQAFVRSHVRRLEALRRAGHTKRIDADHWRVSIDLIKRGQAYDLARDRANIHISIPVSDWPRQPDWS